MPPKKKPTTESREIVKYLRGRPQVAAELSTYLQSQQIQQLQEDIHEVERNYSQLSQRLRYINSFTVEEQARRRLNTERGNTIARLERIKTLLPKGKEKLAKLQREFNPAGDFFWKGPAFGGDGPPPGSGGVFT